MEGYYILEGEGKDEEFGDGWGEEGGRREGGRKERGRDGCRERGREEVREGGREGGRERGREGGRRWLRGARGDKAFASIQELRSLQHTLSDTITHIVM